MSLQSVGTWPKGPRYLVAVMLSCACALLCLPLRGWLDQVNIIMLLLLSVAIAAAWLGRGPGILAGFIGVLLFDILFVEPRFSLTVDDRQYLMTFAVMLIVALLISHLSNLVQRQLLLTQRRERRTRILYECARSFAGAISLEQVNQTLQSSLADSVQARAVGLYLPDAKQCLDFAGYGSRTVPSIPERLLIQNCFATSLPQDSGEFAAAAGFHTVYLPLRGATHIRGVLVMDLPVVPHANAADRAYYLQALMSLLTTALERLHFVDVAQTAELGMQSERLRSSILSSISHDVRTPLTVLCGLADTLQIVQPQLSDESREILQALRTQAFELHGMVDNLLNMARLQSGNVQLMREWQPLEEVIGASIHLLGNALSGHIVNVDIPADLPLLQFDAILMERVFCNLLENAAKFSPPDSTITLTAVTQGDTVNISISNAGSGFPVGGTELLLDVFSRSPQESPVPGFGLGLSICRSIIEAHDGNITLLNDRDGGARVVVLLPLGTPPTVETENPASGAQL